MGSYTHYFYGLVFCGEIYYVGETCNPDRRCAEHFMDGVKNTKSHWNKYKCEISNEQIDREDRIVMVVLFTATIIPKWEMGSNELELLRYTVNVIERIIRSIVKPKTNLFDDPITMQLWEMFPFDVKLNPTEVSMELMNTADEFDFSWIGPILHKQAKLQHIIIDQKNVHKKLIPE